MDLSTLNTAAPAEHGAELHLTHPALGHKLYTGDGASQTGELIDADKATRVSVFVRGLESKTSRELATKLNLARMVLDENNPDDARKLQKIGMEFSASLIVGFSGIERDGKPLEPTNENIMDFLASSEALIGQVLEFAQDKSNFFTNGSAT